MLRKKRLADITKHQLVILSEVTNACSALHGIHRASVRLQMVVFTSAPVLQKHLKSFSPIR